MKENINNKEEIKKIKEIKEIIKKIENIEEIINFINNPGEQDFETDLMIYDNLIGTEVGSYIRDQNEVRFLFIKKCFDLFLGKVQYSDTIKNDVQAEAEAKAKAKAIKTTIYSFSKSYIAGNKHFWELVPLFTSDKIKQAQEILEWYNRDQAQNSKPNTDNKLTQGSQTSTTAVKLERINPNNLPSISKGLPKIAKQLSLFKTQNIIKKMSEENKTISEAADKLVEKMQTKRIKKISNIFSKSEPITEVEKNNIDKLKKEVETLLEKHSVLLEIKKNLTNETDKKRNTKEDAIREPKENKGWLSKLWLFNKNSVLDKMLNVAAGQIEETQKKGEQEKEYKIKKGNFSYSSPENTTSKKEKEEEKKIQKEVAEIELKSLPARMRGEEETAEEKGSTEEEEEERVKQIRTAKKNSPFRFNNTKIEVVYENDNINGKALYKRLILTGNDVLNKKVDEKYENENKIVINFSMDELVYDTLKNMEGRLTEFLRDNEETEIEIKGEKRKRINFYQKEIEDEKEEKDWREIATFCNILDIEEGEWRKKHNLEAKISKEQEQAKGIVRQR